MWSSLGLALKIELKPNREEKQLQEEDKRNRRYIGESLLTTEW